MPNLPLIRKSLVASKDLKKGAILSRTDIEIKRPEGGIAPSDLEKIIGLILKDDVEEDAPIKWSDIQ